MLLRYEQKDYNYVLVPIYKFEYSYKNKPFKTLSAALAANTGGYEIIVYDGTYTGYYQITKDVNITGRGNVVLDVNGYYLNGYVSNK